MATDSAVRLEEVRDVVGVARLELEHPGRAFGGPAEDQRVVRHRVAPVAVVRFEDDVRSPVPGAEGEGPRADRVVERCAAGCLEVLGRLDPERGEGDDLLESRHRAAHREHHGERIGCRHRLDLAPVVTIRGAHLGCARGGGGLGCPGRFGSAGGLGGHRGVGCCRGVGCSRRVGRRCGRRRASTTGAGDHGENRQ